MSANDCDRSGCDRVICDRVICNGQYRICESCFDELLEFKRSWEAPMMRAEVGAQIDHFMDTQPGTYNELADKDAINRQFESLTRQSDEDY